MPYISTFIYCENANVGPNQKLHIEAPLLNFSPLFLPGMFSFSVAMGILDLDLSKDYTFQLLFFSPEKDEKPVVDTGLITLPKNQSDEPSDLPKDAQGIMLNMDFRNVPLRHRGTYRTEVMLNGDKIGTFPIWVQQGREPNE